MGNIFGSLGLQQISPQPFNQPAPYGVPTLGHHYDAPHLGTAYAPDQHTAARPGEPARDRFHPPSPHHQDLRPLNPVLHGFLRIHLEHFREDGAPQLILLT